MMTGLLVFTDLDGTLLDHHSYAFEPALPALQRLAAALIPVIFNSSKTASEIEALRIELKNRHPFIVENGSAVCIPTGYFSAAGHPGADPAETYDIKTFGTTYRSLIEQLQTLRSDAGYRFRGFADLPTKELAKLTGLDETSAALAQQRYASEPLLWDDDPAQLEPFRIDLHLRNLTLVKGGRFYHVMGQVDKADALLWLTGQYQQTWPEQDWKTVALGDGPNDRAMLEAADIAVIIPAAEGKPLQLNRTQNVVCPKETGPRGWQNAMTTILDQTMDKGV